MNEDVPTRPHQYRYRIVTIQDNMFDFIIFKVKIFILVIYSRPSMTVTQFATNSIFKWS